jgi:quinol monooxygenase YgiN
VDTVNTEKRWDTPPLRRGSVPFRSSSTEKGDQPWLPRALLVRFEAKSGKEDAVEEFLLSAPPLVEQEPGTKSWFAVRFGPSTFGIIDAFPDDAARETHLGGPVGKALADKADELFASAPEIGNLDAIANKLCRRCG